MVLEVDPHFPQPGIVEHAIEIIRERDGILVYPTDTIYGIGCDIANPRAVIKLNKVKKRKEQKYYSVMVSDLAMLKKYAKITKKEERILERHLPGPFTFILKAANKIPRGLMGPQETIGIRIPRSRLCKALVKELGRPLITTSLNVSGKKVLTDPQQIPDEMQSFIDVILDAGPLQDVPSTIVDLTKKEPVIIRQGAGIFEW